MATALLTTFNETRKGLLIMWSYRFNTLVELLMLGFIFVGISYFVGGGELDRERLAEMLLGYLVWFYTTIAVSNMSFNLMEEAQAGTLEQMYMSPTSMWMIFVGRVFSTLVTSTAMVVVVGTGLVLLLDIDLPVSWQAVPVFGLTMLGVFGLGFAMGGATLVFKRVHALTNLVTTTLLFINGAFLPVDRLPSWLEDFARLLPTTQGIIVLRNVVLDGQSLRSAWADGSLSSLAIHSFVLLTVGWLVFKYAERVAMRRGTLGQY